MIERSSGNIVVTYQYMHFANGNSARATYSPLIFYFASQYDSSAGGSTVPEPGSVALLALAAGLLAARRRLPC